MEITIKNLKIAKFASKETLCFEAAVYVNGKKLGVATNNGRGGCNLYHGNFAELKNFAISNDPKGFEQMDAMVNNAVAAEEKNHEIKRWCKTMIVIQKKSDPEGSFITLKMPKGVKFDSKIHRPIVENRYGSDVKEILNERF